MNAIISALSISLHLFKKDHILKMLTLVPLSLGLIFYSIMGKFFIVDGADKLRRLLIPQTQGVWDSVFAYGLYAIFALVFYFLIQWTFLAVMALFLAPFNDSLSERTERLLKGGLPSTGKQTMRTMMKNFAHTFVNEIKKIMLLVFIYLLTFTTGLVPFFMPVTLVLMAMMASSQFVDYSWVRSNFSFKQCLGEYKRFFIPYTLCGLVTLLLVTIPFVNVIILPFSVIFYTTLRLKLCEKL